MLSSRYNVELDVFEGPLDLLLHLVKKHELDIFDIPISFVTEKYLDYLNMMKTMNLEIAGEYLLMAATLAFIKSRELLPPDPALADDDADGEHEEEEDPRQELIRRLLEYQKYKNAAASLGERPVVGRNVWMRGLPQLASVEVEGELDPLETLAEFPVIKLIAALDRIMKKAKIEHTHEVMVERMSVSQCINDIAERLEREGQFAFSSCFRFLTEPMSAQDARHEVVVVFLSLLEMAKLNLIRLAQIDDDLAEGEIVISRAAEGIRERISGAIASGADYQ